MINQNLIELVGWLYFFAWSVSFYGQVVLNHRLKSVEGMNLDFLALNLTGYVFYTIYCSYGYFCEGSAAETGRVNLNDIFFVYHALMITLVMVVQAFIYPKGTNRITPFTVGLIIMLVSFSAVYSLLTYVFKYIEPTPYLSAISFMGYFKISINFIKCWPQMIWNFRRKSTKGWSTPANVLDLFGGAFAFLQVAMEHHNDPNIEINLTKVILAAVCMVYDSVFLIQRYCLYPQQPGLEHAKKIGYQRETERVLDNNKAISHQLQPYVIKQAE